MNVHLKRRQCSYCRETVSSNVQVEMRLHSDYCSKYAKNGLPAFGDVNTTHTTNTLVEKYPLCLKEGQHLRNHSADHIQTIVLFVLTTPNPESGDDIDSKKGLVWGSAGDMDSYTESSISASDQTSEEPGGDEITRLDAGFPERRTTMQIP